jgi:hypothetical protein
VKRWTVILGVLFVGFGLIGIVRDSEGWQHAWGGASAVALGGCVLLIACEAVQTGSIRLQTTVITRSSRPALFKLTVSLVFIAALGAIAAGVALVTNAL